MYKVVDLIILIFAIVTYSDGARILGIVPTPSFSHQIAFRPLWRELSLRGHQLTVLTTDPVNDPSLTNLSEIDLHFAYETWNNNLGDLMSEGVTNPLTMIDAFFSTLSTVNDLELQHPAVQKLIKDKNEHFDLLMGEFLFPTMFAFAERFKCPSIAMTSFEAPSVVYEVIGNPVHPILNPDILLPFFGNLNFFERVISVLYKICANYYYTSIIPLEELTVEKHFGKGYPTLEEITGNCSLLFVNVDPVFHQIRPLVPNIIQIGGANHLQSSKPLPKELKKYLDAALEGFIYFSLGSNVKSKDLPENLRNTILQTFAHLPYKVLWKFELDELPGKPANVLISKWFPQHDILRHPNIKLFITQGGLQSLQESLYNHVPVVGMPFFGDQPTNIQKNVAQGLGLSVNHRTVDMETFTSTLLEVINNPKYRNRAKELAELSLDQPLTGLERAVWWTEYVIRHKGAKHLRSPVLDIPFYQYYLLDVIGFCLLLIVVIIYLFVVTTRLVLALVRYFVSKPKVKVQ